MENIKCKRGDRDYDFGSMVCDDRLCYRCDEGGWEKKGALDLEEDAMSQL